MSATLGGSAMITQHAPRWGGTCVAVGLPLPWGGLGWMLERVAPWPIQALTLKAAFAGRALLDAAQRVGLATLEPAADAHVARARALVTESRRLLSDGLTRLGYPVTPSAANFVLTRVGNGAAFRRALLPHGIVVRDCTSFGLPDYVRIAYRLPEECVRLVDTVRLVNI